MRRGFSLVEVLVAGVVFFVMLMVFQTTFQLSTRGEGRDERQTQAVLMAGEVLEQVVGVHKLLGDLPTCSGRVVTPSQPASLTLIGMPGGELHLSADVPGYRRVLSIEEYRVGEEDALVRPDRLYRIVARVEYSGPIGEPREQVLVTTRARRVAHKPWLEVPPW